MAGRRSSVHDASAQDRAIADLENAVAHHFADREGMRVLDAGCGSMTRISVGEDAHVVGIDVSQARLEKNPRLEERIVGNIEEMSLRPSDFDAIICWNVLEHLSHPERALFGFFDAIRSDGLIILSFPNPLSIKGLITKLTPFWFHVWATRHLAGGKTAGTEGSGPFPTYMRFSIAPQLIITAAHERSLTPIFFRAFESNKQKRIREKLRLTGVKWSLVQRCVGVMSAGRIEAQRDQCIVVLHKVESTVVNVV
jgi:ubiquinone/menaquinone biosynthesis C-methylase UbiE